MSRPRAARSVVMRMEIAPERKDFRALRELAEEVVDLVRTAVVEARLESRSERSRDSRGADSVERVKIRVDGYLEVGARASPMPFVPAGSEEADEPESESEPESDSEDDVSSEESELELSRSCGVAPFVVCCLAFAIRV